MGILAWIVLGLIAGAIAKPSCRAMIPAAFIVTIIIGIVGAFHWWVPRQHAHRHPAQRISPFQGIILAVIGSLILLWIYRMATRGRSAPRVP